MKNVYVYPALLTLHEGLPRFACFQQSLGWAFKASVLMDDDSRTTTFLTAAIVILRLSQKTFLLNYCKPTHEALPRTLCHSCLLSKVVSSVWVVGGSLL